MKICLVGEPEMNGAGAHVSYTYLNYVETSLSEHEKTDGSPPLTRERSPFHVLSIPRLPCNVKLVSRRLSLHGDHPSDICSSAGKRLDLLTHLPPEIAVHILRFLHPRHLCSVVQVSRQWYWLAQCCSLQARRLRYVQRKWEKYLQAKENLVPGQRHTNRTPRALTRNSLSHSGSSPLASIQSSRRRYTTHTRNNSPHGISTRDGETPVRLPHFHHSHRRSEKQLTGSPVLETPENYGLIAYRMTSQNETSCIVRRCLFPPTDTPSHSRSKHPTHYSSTYDDTTTVDMEIEPVIKTSASKRRLKRL